MELAKWIKGDDIDNFPMLGKDSFNTFLKVCSEFSDWALDDIGLANRANTYKVWVCKIPSDKLQDVKSILERYSSMKLLLHYYNINIVENNYIALYIKLDWVEKKWQMSYGITNNKSLYKIGEFEYFVGMDLPSHKILKYVYDVTNDFDPREHLALFRIKQSSEHFNPGYCQITDPQIVNKEIIISTYNLGIWLDSGIAKGEAEKYMQVFKNWVKTKKWWDLVHLTVVPRKNKWMDFKIKLK